MSDPCSGEGATHYACDCFLKRMAQLEVVAKAARQLIYPPRTDYAPGSKKAALKSALEKLEEK